MDKGRLSASANLLRLSTLGIQFVLSTFVGMFLGWCLKRFFHWGDWTIMAGFFFGVIAGYFGLLEAVRSLDRDSKKPPAP